MRFLTPVWNYVDALVHPAAQTDALTAARHRAFIAPRLFGSFAALASFPLYVALRGLPSALEVGVFAWLVAPILIAYYLSRTGRYESAHVLSSLALAGLVTVVAWSTGGISSFAAVWLVVRAAEATLRMRPACSLSQRLQARGSSSTRCAMCCSAGVPWRANCWIREPDSSISRSNVTAWSMTPFLSVPLDRRICALAAPGASGTCSGRGGAADVRFCARCTAAFGASGR